VDVDALVHAQLVRVAARCYPAAARRFRQAGEVLVHFCVDQAGAVASSEVHRSSQSPVLDGAATQCVVPQAAPFPPGAFGRCFDVPVRFGAP
jgi:protein TonB